jgi:hypothetical protein
VFPLACAILVAASVPTKESRWRDFQEDSPSVQALNAGYGKVTLSVTAGAGGAPEGFTVLWMSVLDFQANGGRWYPTPHPAQGEAVFTGAPVFNTWGATDYRLDGGETVQVEIGDFLDETGIVASPSGELDGDTRYVFTAYANGTSHVRPSDPAVAETRATRLATCAFTRQNWTNNPQNWPVSGLVLGNRSYTAAQALSILEHPPTQNGLVVLARQLIAAKLNVANGADPTPIQAELSQADLTIGFLLIPPVGGDTLPPSAVRTLVQRLEDFNNGIFSTDPCDPTSIEDSSWGSVKARYR